MMVFQLLLNKAIENGSLIFKEVGVGKFKLQAKFGGVYITLSEVNVNDLQSKAEI